MPKENIIGSYVSFIIFPSIAVKILYLIIPVAGTFPFEDLEHCITCY